MRRILVLIVLILSVTVKAQTFLPVSFFDYTQRQPFGNSISRKDSTADKKWFLNTYSGISTSFSFFKGGNATVVAAPISLQLNRKLTNNLYAFAAVSAAPAYINFNRSFLSANGIKAGQSNSAFKPNSFDMYSKAELGLMYVNDQKTFSISGSIGIERNSYPMLPYNQINSSRVNPVIVPH